jgi:hypothetical protein
MTRPPSLCEDMRRAFIIYTHPSDVPSVRVGVRAPHRMDQSQRFSPSQGQTPLLCCTGHIPSPVPFTPSHLLLLVRACVCGSVCAWLCCEQGALVCVELQLEAHVRLCTYTHIHTNTRKHVSIYNTSGIGQLYAHKHT